MEFSSNEAKKLVEEALSCSCSIDSVYVNRNTLLHIVVYHDLEIETEMVLSRFPTLTILNGNNQTPWDIALSRGNQAVLVKIRNFSIFRDYLLGVNTKAKMSYIDQPCLLYENYVDWGYQKSNAHLQVLLKHVDTMKLQHSEAFIEMTDLWLEHKKQIGNMIMKLTDTKNASYREIYDSIESERNFRQSIVKITETAEIIKSIISSYKKNVFWGGIIEMRRYKGFFLSIWRQYACVICGESVYLYDVADGQAPDMSNFNDDIQHLHDSDRFKYKFRFSVKDIAKIQCNDIESLISSSNTEPSVLKSCGIVNPASARPISFSFGRRTVSVNTPSNSKESPNPEDCELTIEVNNLACFKIENESSSKAARVDDGEDTTIDRSDSNHSLGLLTPPGKTQQSNRTKPDFKDGDGDGGASSRPSIASNRFSTSAPPALAQVPYKISPSEIIYIRMKEVHQSLTNNGNNDKCANNGNNGNNYSRGSISSSNSNGNDIENQSATKSGTSFSDNIYAASPASLSSNSQIRNLMSHLNLDVDSAPSDRGVSGEPNSSQRTELAPPTPTSDAAIAPTNFNAYDVDIASPKSPTFPITNALRSPMLSSSLPKTSINYMSTIGEEINDKSNNALVDNLTEKASSSGVSIQALLSVLSHETSHVSPQSSSNISSSNNSTLSSILSPQQNSSNNSAIYSDLTRETSPLESSSCNVNEDDPASDPSNINKANNDNNTFTSTSSYRLVYRNNLKGLIETLIAILNNVKVDYHPVPSKQSNASTVFSLTIANLSVGESQSTNRPGGGLGYYEIIDNFENDDILILSDNDRESISSIHIEEFLVGNSTSSNGNVSANEANNSTNPGRLIHLTHGVDAFARRVLFGSGANALSPTNRSSMSIASRIAGAIGGGRPNLRDSISSNLSSNSSNSTGSNSGGGGGLCTSPASSSKLSYGPESIANRDSERTTLATNNTNSVSAKSLLSSASIFNNFGDIIFINNSKDTMKIFQQICKLNSLLLETRHKRSYFETQLVYVIETREKSLETIHFLQSLLRFCDNLQDNANAVVLSNDTVGRGVDVLPKPDHRQFHVPPSPKYLLEHYLEASTALSSHFTIGVKLLQAFERQNEFERIGARLGEKLSHINRIAMTPQSSPRPANMGDTQSFLSASAEVTRARTKSELYEVDLN